MNRHRWRQALGVTLLGLMVTRGAAQPAGEFDQHVREAQRLFDKNQYQKSIAELKKARKLKKDPNLLLNMGVAYLEWGGHAAEALGACSAFLREEAHPDAESRKLAQGCVAEARENVPSAPAPVVKKKPELPAVVTVPSGDIVPPPPTPPSGMVGIPAGSFDMGSNDYADEKPVHRVTLKKAFFMDRTEVTVAAYRKCVEAGKCTKPDTGQYCNWEKAGKDTHPINCVDYQQAGAYCSSVGKKLPTEEQWEYATRGAEGRKYPWGNEEPGKQLCWKQSGTCAVGSYPAGTFGLQDMAGNVWEWTSTKYCPNYSNQNCTENYVIRGGSWSNTDPLLVRAADRYDSGAAGRDVGVGFRCARTE